MFRPCLLACAALLAGARSAAQPDDDPFDRWNRDGNGSLSAEELPGPARRNFARVDADGDGAVSREEHRAFRGRRGDRDADRGVRVERDVPYAGTDNPRQRLDIYLPETRRGADPLPVVVFIHGGAWLQGDKSAGRGHLAPLVAGGEYAGVSVGYRLSGEAIWPAQIHDCKAAVRWVRANAGKYGWDAKRIAVMGTSAGGHLVAMLGAGGDVEELEGDLGEHDDASSRVRCVVDYFGPAELLAMGQAASRMDHDSPDSPESRLVGGAIQEHKDAARSASPVTHVTKDDPPFLIIHGSDDPLVPYDQSVRLHEALTAAGVDSTLVKVEGGGHGGFGTREPEARVRRFLDRHLRGQEVEVSEEPIPAGRRPPARER